MAQYPQPQAVVVQQQRVLVKRENHPASKHTGVFMGVGIAVVVQQQRVLVKREKHPASKYTGVFLGVGVAQIVVGICVSVAIGILDARYIFSGALYVVAGGLSVATASSPTRCNVIAGMVFSILAAISSCSFVIAFAFIYSSFSGVVVLELSVTHLVISIVVFCALEAVASIVHFAFCCKGSCCQAQQPGTAFIQQPQVAHTGFVNPIAAPEYTEMPYDDHMIHTPKKRLL